MTSKERRHTADDRLGSWQKSKKDAEFLTKLLLSGY